MHLTTRSHNFKYVLNSSIKLGDSPPGILVSCLTADKWKRHNFANNLKISRNLPSLVSIPKPYPKVKTERQTKNESENRCIPLKA